MRTINRHYTQLLEGYQAVLRYDEAFAAAQSQIRRSAGQRYARELEAYRQEHSRWQQACRAADERFARAYDAWRASEAPQRTVYERALVHWKQRWQASLRRAEAQLQKTRAEGNTCRALFWAAAALSLLVIPAPLTIPAAVFFYAKFRAARRSFTRLKFRRNSIDALPVPAYRPQTPEPRRAAYPPEPVRPSEPAFGEAGSLAEQWWQKLAQDPPGVENPRPARDGDEGEARLLAELGRVLSDDFIAIPGALVEYHMDADVIVIGRNGVWILDSKYFAGIVSYGPEGWAHAKPVFIKGGRGAQEIIPLEVDDLSAQWEREKRSVEFTLKKNMKGPFPPIAGGIAFTYPGAVLKISEDCPVATGTEAGWARQIASIPDDPRFTSLDLVRWAGLILDFSHSREGDHTASALLLADALKDACGSG